MSPPAFSRRLLTWVALGLAAGSGSENNDEVYGIYTLVGVEGSPLPYLERSDAECDEFITLGELRLFEQGTYSLELTGTFDCTRGGGQTGTTGRLYSGTFTQQAGDLEFEAEIQGFGTLRFSGSANPLEAFVTVPPIPPATGPDLSLQFAIVS
jgi:hypothetical protein